MKHRPRNNLAFTLIELVIVLMMLAIMMAIVAPSLSGFSSGRKLDNTVDHFLATARWAQSQAVADAQPYAISIDPNANTYVVQAVTGDTRTAAPGEFGQAVQLPTNFKIAITSGGTGENLILFQPDQRCTPATVRFTSDKNDTTDVSAPSPAEPFAKVVAK